MTHRERMERYARRHGYQSYRQLRQALLDEQKSETQRGSPAQALEAAAAQALIDNGSGNAGVLETDEQLRQLASGEIRRQVQVLLERFPRLQEELGRAYEDGGEAALEALGRLRNGPEVLSCWRDIRQAGLELADAYLLKNYRQLLEQQSEAARQSAINSMAGRAHLLPSSGSQGEEVRIPGGVYALYRELNPGATEQEIRAHYKRSAAR